MLHNLGKTERISINFHRVRRKLTCSLSFFVDNPKYLKKNDFFLCRKKRHMGNRGYFPRIFNLDTGKKWSFHVPSDFLQRKELHSDAT
jgi:hypothetical protein